MNATYIKLFRKLKEHEIMRDSTSFHIFIWILMSVDYKSGKMISGRFWASSLLGINPNTYHKALQRLEKKYDLVTLSSNNKNTTVIVKNWSKYQSDDNTISNNKVTTNYQQSNTNQEIKEIRNNIYDSNEIKIFSFFKELKEDNEKIVELAQKYDIRPKDLIDTINVMLSKESEKGVEIKNVKAKLNIYVTNGLRWHYLSKISDKAEKEQSKKQAKLSRAEREELEFLKSIKIV